MNDSNNDLQNLIEKYLLGQITKKELDMLEHQLSTNPELANQLKQDLEIVSGIQSYGNQKLKNRLKKIHKEVVLDAPQQTKIRRIGFRQMAIAATVTLLLVAGIWFLLKEKTPTDIYAANYKPYSNISLTTRSDGSPIANAETLYKQKQYSEALPILENELTKPAINNADQIRLAIGICEMELANFQKAITHFEVIIENNNLLIVDQAIWYSALSNIKLGNQAKAKSLFEILAKDSGMDYHKEAKVILAEME